MLAHHNESNDQPYESERQAVEKIQPAPGDLRPADATTGFENDALHHRQSGAPNFASAPNFPIVGLGASAGGVAAVCDFFRHVSPASGMAYVVIVHLSPYHESTLDELIARETEIPVLQVRERVRLEANHAYVIAPDKHLMMEDGHLCVSEPEQRRGRRVPIDLFFRTLADTHDSAAAVVVLSGTGTDGTIGIKRIKERDGLTLAQLPEEAEHDGMPRSAIETGLVDWVLPVAEMPRRISDYFATGTRILLPHMAALVEGKTKSPSDPTKEVPGTSGTGVQPKVGVQPEAEDQPVSSAAQATAQATTQATAPVAVQSEQWVLDVLNFVHQQTGHDFSLYKRGTIMRRMARRMQLHGLEELPSYLDFLHAHPEEAAALLREILISVTNFFRDAEAFSALQTEVLPRLFSADRFSRERVDRSERVDHSEGVGSERVDREPVRVWVPACATGEEVYSLAMLFTEYIEWHKLAARYQIFATDLDEASIVLARQGSYVETIAADVSPERLQRFFYREQGRYRIKKEIRENVLFAVHDVLQDTPFSHLDLISAVRAA